MVGNTVRGMNEAIENRVRGHHLMDRERTWQLKRRLIFLKLQNAPRPATNVEIQKSKSELVC